MGNEEDEIKYTRLAEKLEGLIRKEFWDKPVEGKINRQTLFASLLYYDIVPPDEIPAAADSLMEAVRKGPDGHFTTGIFGTSIWRHGVGSTKTSIRQRVYTCFGTSRKYDICISSLKNSKRIANGV